MCEDWPWPETIWPPPELPVQRPPDLCLPHPDRSGTVRRRRRGGGGGLRKFWWTRVSKAGPQTVLHLINSRLTGNMTEVPGGPGTPSAPGRPGFPDAPWGWRQEVVCWSCCCCCFFKYSIQWPERTTQTWTTHPLTRVSNRARGSRGAGGAGGTLHQRRRLFRMLWTFLLMLVYNECFFNLTLLLIIL